MNMHFLERLLHTQSVSGFEHEISTIFSNELVGFVDEVKVDVLGNTYAFINSNDAVTTIMIEAHCDEVGFQVVNIGESGFVYIRRNGGVDEQCIPGSQVTIRTANGETIYGIIGKKPIHLMSADDRKKTLEISQVWVDTGLSTEMVHKLVSIGDTVAVAPNFRLLGESRISGKALDNKVGVFIVAEVLKRVSQHKGLRTNVVGVASVQEEVGSRGAGVATYNVCPDIAVTVDVDFATDVPDLSHNKYGKVALGQGVVIPRNVDVSQLICRQFEEVARLNNLPYQVSARPHATGGTNISRIQLARNGVRAMSLGIPCRYMHTPVEMCDINDINACIDLLCSWILQQ